MKSKENVCVPSIYETFDNLEIKVYVLDISTYEIALWIAY